MTGATVVDIMHLLLNLAKEIVDVFRKPVNKPRAEANLPAELVLFPCCVSPILDDMCNG